MQQQRASRIEQQKKSKYYGADWRALRARHLAKYPACVNCGTVSPSNNVDHIVPHCGDERLRLDPDNLQTLCHSCSSRKTATFDGGFGRARRKAQ